ncbi:MAG: hypothetical protein ACFCUS_01885 [Rubrimonas sp.]
MPDPIRETRFRRRRKAARLVPVPTSLSPASAETLLSKEGEQTMTGLELLLMPLFTMGSMIVFAVSQIRSVNRDR